MKVKYKYTQQKVGGGIGGNTAGGWDLACNKSCAEREVELMGEEKPDPPRRIQDTRGFFMPPQNADGLRQVAGEARRPLSRSAARMKMKETIRIALGACWLVSVAALAAESLATWRPLQAATYKIFAGESVAYSATPKAKDRKLSIAVTAQAARDIFDAIGPDDVEACSTEKGDRERSKGAVQCIYTASDKSYRCWIGVDLNSGRGIPTVAC